MVLAVGIEEDLWLLQKHKMAASFTIGIDLMGADVPPDHIFRAATSLPADFYSNTSLVFFGTQDVGAFVPHSSLHMCPDVIRMDDSPVQIIRENKKTTLATGIQELHEGKISAFISCANTGALVALARKHLETLSGITKPALMCEVPTETGYVMLLDVGANVEASNELLLSFAHLGAAFSQKDKPKVALLNIGEEHTKGTQELKSTYSYFKEHTSDLFEFVGNKEPYDVYTHQADIFITTGFSGNLFLKSSEAASRFVLSRISKRYPDMRLDDIVDEGHGAILLGLKKLVVKCHGRSSIKAIQDTLINIKASLERFYIY